MTTPARGWSWPPFEPGNDAALKHGADSERVIAPIASAIAAELVAIAPWVAQPVFMSAIAAWARAEARVQVYAAWFDEHGLFDEHGQARPGVERWERAEATARVLRNELGLTPAAWAKLCRDLTVDPDGGAAGAEALRALGRQLLESTAAEAPSLPVSAPGGEQGEDGVGEELGGELGEDGREEAGHHQPPPALHGGAS